MPDQVVSTPAIRVSAAMPMITRSSTGLPSTSACSNALMRSSPGFVAAVLQLLEQVQHHGVATAGGPGLLVGELEEVLHPAGEGLGHLVGDPEHERDDAHRNLAGVVAGGIG